MKLVWRIGVVLAALIAAGATAGSGAAPASSSRGSDQTLTPVIQDVMSQPRWFRGEDGRIHVEYELRLTNATPVAVTLASLEVRSGGGREIASLSGEPLKAATSPLGSPNDTLSTLGPATVAIVWIDVTVADRRHLPRRLEHEITVDLAPGLPLPETSTETGARVEVARRAPVVIRPPLLGSQWTTIVGAHRRSLQPVNGSLQNGQRFAIDWNRLDPENRPVNGDPGENTSYPSYGAPVVAVDDAKVVRAVDGLPDQDPDDFHPVPVERADGNFVVLKLAPRTFAGYAHLIPGSVRVHRGERVSPGDVLGELGNSGNSDGPHLHFQLMNRPSLLAADALPFGFDRYRLDGHVPSFDDFAAALETQSPVPIDTSVAGVRRRSAPLGIALVDLSRGG